jgi:peptidoglycan/xylan/chitin deacetylase (PgdA/CDA1 family)
MARLLRRLRAVRSRWLGRAEPLVLMYHRVARVPCDPWRLAVAPERFAEQIDVLSKRRTIVPLDWLVDELEHGRTPRKSVAITFDDGYADVLHDAKPILEGFRAPATAFLTTGAIGRRREFWWDRLSRLLLETPELPDQLTLDAAGSRQVWRVVTTGARARSDDVPALDRSALHLAVWSALRPLGEATRDSVLSELEAWAGRAPAARAGDRALDPDEARALAAGDLIRIGAHSVSHASLPALPSAEARREMAESRAALEQLLSRPVTGFAFPFGDHDAATEALAGDCGFHHACSADPGVVSSILDRFRLPRVAVDDWDADEFSHRLLGWR